MSLLWASSDSDRPFLLPGPPSPVAEWLRSTGQSLATALKAGLNGYKYYRLKDAKA